MFTKHVYYIVKRSTVTVMMVVLKKEENREKEVCLTDVSRKFLIGKNQPVSGNRHPNIQSKFAEQYQQTFRLFSRFFSSFCTLIY